MSVRDDLAGIRERVQALGNDAPYPIEHEVRSILKAIDELSDDIYNMELEMREERD